VLSIHKLTTGHGRYYIDGAEGRVDVVESIGDEVEEYYAGPSTEARSAWMGVGARELGLSGAVDGEELRRVLDGLDGDGEPLRGSSGAVRNAGYDLTFSAPKSVSVLFGLGEVEVREAVRAAHDAAVSEALGYMERTAAAVRRGHGGLRVEPASGFVAAAFRHRTSRAGDPQLHTHVLVANLGRGPDGRWSALDGRRLYAQARSASFIYQAVLRSELSRSLGVEWRLVRRGIAELAAVPRSVVRAFSRRRAQIEAELQAHGTSSPQAAEAAALSTRGAKDRSATPESLREEWLARAAALGFAREQLAAVTARERMRRPAGVDLERLFDGLASPTGLTRSQSSFDRGDVIQALCELLPAAARVTAAGLEATADGFLERPDVAALVPEDESFRRRDRRRLPLAREGLRYSTTELLAQEQQLVATAASSEAVAPTAAERDVRRAIRSRPTLSDEQRQMIEELCLDGRRVAVVAGKAGTGKTFALTAAREAWQAAGHPVLGVAVARRAARELETGAGIQSTSVAALLQDLARGHGLPRGSVLVLDEAGMAPTRDLATLLENVEHAGGKLVLVGDHRQLPEIEAGGAFRALVRRGLAVELTENQRQREPWERRALDLIADGHADRAVPQYVQHERIHLADTSDQTMARLVADWSAGSRDAVMLAHRRADVAQLNELARERLRDAGLLYGPELELAGGRFAAGDQLVIKRNEPALGVSNGDRGEVLAVDPVGRRMLASIDDRRVELGPDFLDDITRHGDPTLLHGYAVTVHVAQGLTVDHAHLLTDHGLTRELSYTALSRGRHSNHLYLTRHPDDPHAEIEPTDPPRDPIDRLTQALQRSDVAELAIDMDPHRQVQDAEQRLRAASAERRGLEETRWSPRRRGRLDDATRREREAAHQVERARRLAAEQQHGAKPFVTQIELARTRERQIDQVVERGRRGVGRGREL
jgi:conjugative relaxase-like TrwC/TraI family protein